MFESHITVKDTNISHFIDLCSYLEVKPVFIIHDTGSNINQMMTAKFHRTDNMDKALEEMHGIASNFNVVRRKLEAIGKWDGETLYEEIHAKFKIPLDMEGRLEYDIKRAGGHASQNNHRPGFMFATFRHIEDYKNFLLVVDKKTFQHINTIREYVVYDDNPKIDINWACFDCPIKNKNEKILETT